MIRYSLTSLLLLAPLPVMAQEVSFDYEQSMPLVIQQGAVREEDGVKIREISYQLLDGSRNNATVVQGEVTGSARPAILFVHWYGPPAPTSNRTEFLPDAIAMARAGAISLLIDTPWSKPDYFEKRTRDEDYERSVQQVKDLRRALDVLFTLPAVDEERVAYVGHDFGAMYGALTAAVDTRVKAFVFMAGTQSFSDWFLYGAKPPEAERERFVAELAPLDPIKYLPKLKIPVMLQFANDDEHVSKVRATALGEAAREPKSVLLYNAQHELNDDARRDRLAWLKKTLKLETR